MKSTALLSLLLASCTFLARPAPAPLRMQVDAPDSAATELVVLLPGRHSLPDELVREGFVEKVRTARTAARIVTPDLHIGYYKRRSTSARLHDDIIAPARAAGIEHVTLVGISMGGLGAMLYELERPGEIDEILLLSPFLGDDEVIEDIAAQGGLARWQPQGEAPDRFSRPLWEKLRDDWLRRDARALLRLGCGESDRLAATTRLAARELSPVQTVWLPGDHDWPTWNALIETQLRDSTSAQTSSR